MSRQKGSKNKKEPSYSPCKICGNTYKTQGLGTHIREKHQTVYRKETHPGLNQNQTGKKVPAKEIIQKPIFQENNSQSQIQSSCDVPVISNEMICPAGQKKPLYTINDLCILKGKLYNVLIRYTDTYDLMSEMMLRNDLNTIKQNFYQRFETSLKQLETDHPELFCKFKNVDEEMEDRAKFLPYAELKYSDE